MTNFISEHANEIITIISEAERQSCYSLRCEFYNMDYPSIKINGWDDKRGISVDYYMSEVDVEEWIETSSISETKERVLIDKIYNLVRQEEMRRNAVLMKMGEK